MVTVIVDVSLIAAGFGRFEASSIDNEGLVSSALRYLENYVSRISVYVSCLTSAMTTHFLPTTPAIEGGTKSGGPSSRDSKQSCFLASEGRVMVTEEHKEFVPLLIFCPSTFRAFADIASGTIFLQQDLQSWGLSTLLICIPMRKKRSWEPLNNSLRMYENITRDMAITSQQNYAP